MYETNDIIIASILAGIILCLPIVASAVSRRRKELEFIEKHRKIRLGMSKFEVIGLLGKQYTQSYLKNDVEKLEWRYRHNGYIGRVARGTYLHTSSYTRRISVKFKGNIVIEVNSVNMD